MSFLLWHRDGDVGIAAGRRVLRAAEVPVFNDALALCRRLQALHDDESARVEAASARAGDEGRRQGFEAGTRAAAEQQAARLTELGVAAARHREVVDGQVAALALQVARKLIGSLADDERLVALAATAARELVPDTPLVLAVHPDQAAAVARRVAEGRAAAGADAPPFEVRADDAVPPDGCRLDTGLGTVDASLDTQLRRIAQAWGLHDLPAATPPAR